MTASPTMPVWSTLVEGNRENIKITTPYDIIVAEAIIQYQLSIIH